MFLYVTKSKQMAKKKVRGLKALLSVEDKFKRTDTNMTFEVEKVNATMYEVIDENGVKYDNYGIIGVDNAIEKSKSIIKL